MPGSLPKPIVTSWDVFDTLVARFVQDPHAVFHSVAASHNAPDFVQRRLGAQAALDRVGNPYVLHDIYRQMVADGTAPADARALLRAELAAERLALVPIHRNVARFDPMDIILSDMYLSPETISGFLFETCDLHTHRPIIRSNWGKHTGTIWPLVLASYVVRRHVGDNPVADSQMPMRFRIGCELVTDAQLTPWERKLDELGLRQLVLIQREVRLRTVPPDAIRFHEAVVGPYLTTLVCFAMYLVHRFGQDAEFAFLSRSTDELCRVFAALFPAIPARSLDISRRLAGNDAVASLFAAGITPATVVVDMAGTGRSFFRFAERHGNPGRCLILFMYLALLLKPDEAAAHEGRERDGRQLHAFRIDGGRFWCLEHLLQAHYPPVGYAALDAKSGGVVRTFGATDLDRAEAGLIAWKSATVTELVRTLRRRGMADPGAGPLFAAMQSALQTIMADPAIMAPFTSFTARERMDWA